MRKEAPPGLAAAIHDQTDGNPLFMVTLTSHLISKGLLRRSGGGWNLLVAPESLVSKAPESLREVVEDQLSILASGEREVLEVASVVGESFATQVLAAGLGVDTEKVEETCDRLSNWRQFIEKRGVSRWPDETVASRYDFQHSAFPRLLCAGISPSRRRKLHLEIAKRMEVGYASAPEAPSAEIANHFERGGERLRTVIHLARAAASDQRRSGHREAASYLRRAAEMLARTSESVDRDQRELEVRFELSRSVAIGLGWGTRELGENLDRCLELSRKLGDTRAEAFTLGRITRRASFRSDNDAARATLEELRRVAPQVESAALRTDLAYNTGFLALLAGKLDQAEETFAASREIQIDSAELFESVLYNPRALSLSAGSWCTWLRGFPDDARDQARAGIEESRLAHERVSIAAAHAIAAALGQFMGQADEVRTGLERYRAELSSSRFLFRSPIIYALEGWEMLEGGDVDDAIAHLSEGVTRVRSAGTTLWTSCLYIVLVETLHANGAVNEGLRSIEEALDYCAKSGERAFEPELHRLRGELQLLVGASEAAEKSFVQALELARAQGARSLELRVATSLARSWHQQGESDRARGVLEPIFRSFDQGSDTRDLLTAEALLQAL